MKPRNIGTVWTVAMTDRESDAFPTVAVVLLLVLLAAVLLGGLAMVGMMGSSWHHDTADNDTWHDGMMGGHHDMGAGWALVAIVLGVIFVIAVLWLLGPGRESRPRTQPYQQPIAPQPYPVQPPPRPPAPQQPPRKDAAVEILEERLARGEISEKEYLGTLETLKKGRAG